MTTFEITVFCLASISVLGSPSSSNRKIRQHDHQLAIIGGVEAEPHSAPEVVYLLLTDSEEIACVGTLLSHKYVLTAAQCVKSPDDVIMVYIGIHNRCQQEAGAEYIAPQNWAIHPNVDIAILLLYSPVSYSDTIKPVVLPSRADAGRNWDGALGSSYGWGQTGNNVPPSDVLRQTYEYVISLDECSKLLEPFNKTVSHGHICTLADEKGVHKGICDGDFGGPLFIGVKQIGIASYRTGRCEEAVADIYVKVDEYLDWIAENSDVVIR